MFDFLTRGVRGVGRLLRGKFREGIDDLGYTAKKVAPVVSAFNPLLGAAVGTAGRVANEANEGVGKIKVFKDLAVPAAVDYGVGRALKSFKGGAFGKSGPPTAAAEKASGMAESALEANSPMLSSSASVTGRMGADDMIRGVGSIAQRTSQYGADLAPKPTGVGGILSGMKGAASNVGKWAGKNPVLATGIAGQTLGAIGAYKEGQAIDSQLQYEREREEEIRRAMGPYIEKLAALINQQSQRMGL